MHTPNGLYSLWDLLGSFLSKSNGARPLALNCRGAHLTPILAKNSSDPKKPKMEVEIQDDSNGWQTPVGTSFLQTGCPLNTRENLPQIIDPGCRNQECGIYGIIYHYSPFFLINSMVILSRLHLLISSHIASPLFHFQRKTQVTHACNP
ncbi:hypothetical protein O181_090354 [Austropuccinia psidii MF-1]|uniref:Uncharacterized protein n=1 Tax=Austropuccinia psidii MF-1 TaxID=1389203 RepID=A0A9Q3P6U6_9BASI|nr:hypothetical protein [Austropuccinia psidii MF-1]